MDKIDHMVMYAGQYAIPLEAEVTDDEIIVAVDFAETGGPRFETRSPSAEAAHDFGLKLVSEVMLKSWRMPRRDSWRRKPRRNLALERAVSEVWVDLAPSC